MSLGSIYETSSSGAGLGKARGRDLSHRVSVPPRALGQGVLVQVPDKLAVRNQSERAKRAQPPGEAPGSLTLHLPEGFRSGSALRLRGYGEEMPQGQAGDLFLVVDVDPEACVALVKQNRSLAATGGASAQTWVGVGVVSGVLALLLWLLL